MKFEGKIIFILFSILFLAFTYQDYNKIERIKQSLTKTNSSKDKVELYKELAEEFNKQLPDSSRKYAFLALKFSNNIKLNADLLFKIGLNFNYQSEYDSSLVYYKKSLTIYEQIKDSIGIGNCYYRLGLLATIRGNYIEALDYCYKAVDILEHQNDYTSLAYAQNYLAIVLYITDDLANAEKQMYKALEFSEKIKDDNNKALANEHFAILFIKKGDYEKAKNYVNKSIELRKKNNDNAGLSGSYENLAIIYRNQKKYDLALEYYNKSLEIKKTFNSIRGIASSYLGIGITYLNIGDYQKAIDFINKSIEIRLKIKDKRGLASSYSRLSEVYEKINDFKSSLKYYKLSKEYSDSLLNERNTRNIAELKEKHEAKQKEEKLNLLNIENEFYRNRSNYLILISILLIGLILALVIAYNSKRKLVSTITNQNNELEKLNSQLTELIQAREKIYSIIAHDLKSPFQGILGATEILESDFNNLSNNEKIYFITGVRNLAKQTFRLLENLLEWSKFQTNKVTFFPENCNLYLEIFPTINYLKTLAEEKNINLIFEIDPNININVDKNMISSIIRNLISNAIKYTNESGTIKIYSKEYESNVEIFIEDNGIGMDEELQKNLFTFNRSVTRKGTKNEKGTGLGLLLCKEMIEKHNGEIRIQSEVGKGTTISFTLDKNL
ncbi:MAG: tetratricopeptide repeat-containing sensor histidine kinase [Melioribacteraceae bacterium]|nr:tetratricopeptide repeat-containing sensor histidine kinase [Melioribacteraceae bacterium]